MKREEVNNFTSLRLQGKLSVLGYSPKPPRLQRKYISKELSSLTSKTHIRNFFQEFRFRIFFHPRWFRGWISASSSLSDFPKSYPYIIARWIQKFSLQFLRGLFPSKAEN